MTVLDVTVAAPDGTCPASLHLPDGGGPWPAVIMYPDAAGVRTTFRAMADRMAGLGYATLLPDVYYREGDWKPFSAPTSPNTSAAATGCGRLYCASSVFVRNGAAGAERDRFGECLDRDLRDVVGRERMRALQASAPLRWPVVPSGRPDMP